MQMSLRSLALRKIPVGPLAMVNFTPYPAHYAKAIQRALLDSRKPGHAFLTVWVTTEY